MSSNLLIHFNSNFPLVLACDASQYGIGAVLAHRLPDGSEQPIGYISCTLNTAERNYLQLEKEGLACVFGVKRFYSYLFSHSFQLIMDHKPLLGLLSECKSTLPQASARVCRWSYLSQFEYRLTFRWTTAHTNADALSRLPLPVQPEIEQLSPEMVLLCQHLDDSPITAKHIKEKTSKDPLLSTVEQFVLQGWPDSISAQPALRPFFECKLELAVYQGCILWGSHVVIPEDYREHVLYQLHEGHPGVARMKSLARMYGGRGFLQTSSRLFASVNSVNYNSLHHLLLLYSHGHGLPDLGPDYILIMQVHLKARSGADLGFLEWWGCKYKCVQSVCKIFSHAHLIKNTPI